jgi:glucans biosynthesis protein C
MGGMKWQSLGYALWEQFTGVSLIIGLLGISKKFFNSQGKLAIQLSDSAYGVFIFHAPVIVGLAAIFRPWDIFPPLKFIVLAPVALFTCFLVAFLVKKLPLVKKIL